jgi:hypothetical protein
MLNANRYWVGAMRASCGRLGKGTVFGILGISVGMIFSLELWLDLDARAQTLPDRMETSPAAPRSGDADLLRNSPGEPLLPTVASPLTFKDSSRTLPSEAVIPITFSIEPITPVTPYIPSASPVSPGRDAPGALTTDPVRAFPLIDSNFESKSDSKPQQ